MLSLTDMPIQITITSYAKWHTKVTAVCIVYGQYFLYLFLAAIVIHLGWLAS